MCLVERDAPPEPAGGACCTWRTPSGSWVCPRADRACVSTEHARQAEADHGLQIRRARGQEPARGGGKLTRRIRRIRTTTTARRPREPRKTRVAHSRNARTSSPPPRTSGSRSSVSPSPCPRRDGWGERLMRPYDLKFAAGPAAASSSRRRASAARTPPSAASSTAATDASRKPRRPRRLDSTRSPLEPDGSETPSGVSTKTPESTKTTLRRRRRRDEDGPKKIERFPIGTRRCASGSSGGGEWLAGRRVQRPSAIGLARALRAPRVRGRARDPRLRTPRRVPR